MAQALAHRAANTIPANARTHVQVCRSNGSAAMLAAKRSAGVTSEVNLRMNSNLLSPIFCGGWGGEEES